LKWRTVKKTVKKANWSYSCFVKKRKAACLVPSAHGIGAEGSSDKGRKNKHRPPSITFSRIKKGGNQHVQGRKRKETEKHKKEQKKRAEALPTGPCPIELGKKKKARGQQPLRHQERKKGIKKKKKNGTGHPSLGGRKDLTHHHAVAFEQRKEGGRKKGKEERRDQHRSRQRMTMSREEGRGGNESGCADQVNKEKQTGKRRVRLHP